MKIFVTGVAGQVGHDVMAELLRRGHVGVGSDLLERFSGDDEMAAAMSYCAMDITDAQAVERTLSEIQPDAVIHCAAWTAVDLAEDEDKRDKVDQINAKGPENIARCCQRLGCKMMQISTDYVFSGQGTEPWKPDCQDFAPLSVYAASKLAGEQAVSRLMSRYFIVRIAWLFGSKGQNFVRTMLNLSNKYDSIRVVNDQIGTPTYSSDLARLLVDMIETDRYGYYHASNEGGYISWYDFACEIFRQAGQATKVIPVSTEEYGLSKAVRPLNSRLDKRKLTENGFEPLPDWHDALRRYLNTIEK